MGSSRDGKEACGAKRVSFRIHRTAYSSSSAKTEQSLLMSKFYNMEDAYGSRLVDLPCAFPCSN